MKEFPFTIKSLIYDTDDLMGPITQVLFAKSFAEQMEEESYRVLCLVDFEDPSINKALPGSIPLEETLLLGSRQILHLCVRGKGTYCHIATGHYPGRVITIHEMYRHAILQNKLSDSAIATLYERVWDSPTLIAPLPMPFPFEG